MPSRKRLYGSAELQERLRVSRARVVQIVSREDFPAPFERLAGGTVWLAEEVEAWIREHRPHLVEDDVEGDEP